MPRDANLSALSNSSRDSLTAESSARLLACAWSSATCRLLSDSFNAASFWALSACSHPPMPPAMRMTAATAAKAQRVIRCELAMRACASAVRAWAAFISATCALSRSRASSFLARR